MSRFQVGQTVKSLKDKPNGASLILAGDVVTVAKSFITSITGENEFMYEYEYPVGSNTTYTGVESDFTADLNAPIQLPLGSSTVSTTYASLYGVSENSAKVPNNTTDKKVCDCGGEKAETTHAFWCYINKEAK